MSDHEQNIASLVPSARYDYEFEGHRRIVYIGDGIEHEITSEYPIEDVFAYTSSLERPTADIINLPINKPYLIQFNFAPKIGERITLDYLVDDELSSPARPESPPAHRG